MNSEETRLKNILQEMQNPQVSLKKVKELYQKANINILDSFNRALKGEETKEDKLKIDIFLALAKRMGNLKIRRKTNKEINQFLVQLTDEKFDLVELASNELANILRYIELKWNSFDDDKKKAFNQSFLEGYKEGSGGEVISESEIKEYFEKFSKFLFEIKNERSRREQLKNNSSDSSIPDLNNSIQSLEQQLKNLQDQINNKDSSTKLDQIQQKLNQLAEQIKSLTNNNPQQKTQLNNLKQQQQQVQNQLKEKQEQVSSGQNNQTAQTQSQFN